jgi:MarR family transcriptional regulator, lower aerobic nicotinate degradation pathway regulator
MAASYSARVTLDHTTAEQRLPLTTQLGMLLRVAHARAGRRANEALRPLGLEGRHLGVLLVLDRSGPLSQTRIGEELGADKSAMGRTVDDLERLGAAERRADPADRRARQVSLTAEGVQLVARAKRAAAETADEIFQELTVEEQITLRGLLTRVARS